MKIAEMCRLSVFGVTALLILSGCAMEKFGSPQLVPSGPYRSTEAAQLELTASEEAVFERTGTLDRNLNPTMEFMVKYHFIKYSRERRITMEHFLRNALPYLNYTKSVFRAKGLPQDLAYLAYLESGYNPLAVSRSKATGMWQFISSTGKLYGLSQDWWVDERMDPYQSTHAAADYLTRLYEIFHDWHLAIASYNGGEGAVGRAQKAAGASGLHDILKKNDELDPSVQLREETRLYVPRFLALVKIMREPESLGLKPLGPDADHPVLLPVVELKAKPATDLVELARRLGMTWKEFLAYNPHFLRSISPAGRTASVYVPRGKEEQARKLLDGRLSGAGWRYHKVRSGETWASISKKTGIPVSILRQLNPQKLKKGQSLRMPSVKGSVPPFEPMVPNYEPTAKTSAANTQQNVTAALAELEGKVSTQEEVSLEPVVQRTHKIKSGDTLSGIAKKYGTTVREIYKANGGQDKLKTLRIGQIVKLPYTKAQLEQLKQQRKEKARRAEEARKAAEARAKAELAKATSHKVQKGDTLSGIARKYGVTVKELQKANGGAAKLKTLRIGQEIALPARGQAAQVSPAVVVPAPAAPVVEKAVKPAAKAEPAVKAPVKHEEPRAATARPSEHKVQSGDTLSRIARKYGVSVKELQQANGGADKLKTLRIGQVIAIPVQAGEAETEAAAAALSELKAAAGQKAVTAMPAAPVVAPASVPAPKPAVAPAASTGGIENYKVQSGDSIWRISRRFGMSVDEFKSLNEGIDSSSLRLGATVRVIRRK